MSTNRTNFQGPSFPSIYFLWGGNPCENIIALSCLYTYWNEYCTVRSYIMRASTRKKRKLSNFMRKRRTVATYNLLYTCLVCKQTGRDFVREGDLILKVPQSLWAGRRKCLAPISCVGVITIHTCI